MNLLKILPQKLHNALSGMVADPAPYAAMLKPAQDARHGDYQANCAMSLAKVLGRKPQDVARDIVARLDLGDWLHPPEVAGPGFINLRLREDWLAAQLRLRAADNRLGIPCADPVRTIVIDYSSPNVAKPLHVGHLRSTIIGDALTRLLRFLGHRVITDNHLGDWGTQFGMLIYGYKHFLNPEALAADPVREMSRIYVEVRKLMSEEKDVEKGADPVSEACRQETAKLHSGDAENVRLWQQFMPVCLQEIDDIYQRLDVAFDHQHGESFYNPMLPEVVRDLQTRGIAQESQGAIAIFFDEKEPPALIQKRDGAFSYMTSDLATIRYRVQEWNPHEILYVVDFRQSLHFKHLFEAARRWGYDQVGLRHVAFGTVLGEDRKPLRTRDGKLIELEELLDEAIRRAVQVYQANRAERTERNEEVPELSEDELRPVIEAVGLGAVKYADLCQNRSSDYVFDWDKMLAMNGNTATYMQYAYARVHGIFRKSGVTPEGLRSNPPEVVLNIPHERALAIQLLRLGEALDAAAAEALPSTITSYLWDLSKAYSGFFQNCPVLKAETVALRNSRLLLCDLTGRTIQLCLKLLGIRTMERI